VFAVGSTVGYEAAKRLVGDVLVLYGFVAAVAAAVLIFVVNVKKLKRKIPRWDAYATMLFVRSIGSFGEEHAEKWMRTLSCREEESRTIIRHQLLCLLEILAAWFAIALFMCVYVIWTQQVR
jgi:hypothetical protein